jgi:hypothetical protein
VTPVVIITFGGHGSRDHRLIAFDTRFDSWDAECDPDAGTRATLPQVRRQGSDLHSASPCTALVIGRTHPDVVARTAAFLLLNDSKSSFRIDGDSPATTPQHDGGWTIAQAGMVDLNNRTVVGKVFERTSRS